MIADSNQTGILETSRPARFAGFGRMVGWLILGFAVASLLVGLIGSYNSVRYPGAEPQAVAASQFQFQPIGSFSQQNAYQTPDDLPQVLAWYAGHFSLGHETPQGDHCVTMTRVNEHLILRPSLAITLCAQPTRTLIFVNRSIALR